MSGAFVWAVVMAMLIAANLPFFSPRMFLVGPLRPARGWGWHLLEMLVLSALVALGAVMLESRLGQRAPQGWEFYAVLVCLMLTFGFPGFVWRHLRRHREQA
jgi:hypothetical protein